MRRVATCVPLVLLVAACGADFWYFETNNLTGGPTILIISWSDSPLDQAEALNVALDRLELLGDGDAPEVLAEGRRVHDLLSLQNGRTAELARVEVPAGRYAGLRFFLAPDSAGAHTIRIAGGVEPLVFAQPGGEVVDVPIALDLPEDGETVVHVDFDVRMSVYPAGPDWVLDPQLRALDPRGAGAVEGVVRTAASAPLGGATVSAQQEGVQVLSTRSQPDGSFRLAPLAPGRYDLVATAVGHAPAALHDVAVHAGSDLGGQVLTLDAALPGALDGSAPVGQAGLTVRVVGTAGLVALTGVDPLTGLFALPSVPPGVYTVELWRAGVPVDRLTGVLVVAGAATTILF